MPIENRFINRFQNKPDSDLKFILSNPNDYEFDAIEAAHYILEERKSQNITIDKTNSANVSEDVVDKDSPSRKRSRKRKKPNLKLDFKSFFKNYDRRTIKSHISISLLYSTILLVFDYYSGEADLIFDRAWTIVISGLAILYLNNIFYKLDNRIEMTFYTRCLNGITFCLYFVLLYNLNSSLLLEENPFADISFTGTLAVLFIISILVFVFELLNEGFLNILRVIANRHE